jgi:type III secretory pathway component EscS
MSRNLILFTAIVLGLIVVMFLTQAGASTGVFDESVMKVIKVIGVTLSLILYGSVAGGGDEG